MRVAYCASHVVPGIDFTNDPLLQGRLFSYQDTQLKRLGSANFHQIPINQPKCPFHNLQRDGHMQMSVPKGQVNYEPSSLGDDVKRESQAGGYRTFPNPEAGEQLRVRPETFADHYTQARLFFLSQTEPAAPLRWRHHSTRRAPSSRGTLAPCTTPCPRRRG